MGHARDVRAEDSSKQPELQRGTEHKHASPSISTGGNYRRTATGPACFLVPSEALQCVSQEMK
jgi:hypothetical protein